MPLQCFGRPAKLGIIDFPPAGSSATSNTGQIFVVSDDIAYPAWTSEAAVGDMRAQDPHRDIGPTGGWQECHGVPLDTECRGRAHAASRGRTQT